MRMHTKKDLKNTRILAARNTSSHTSGFDIILLYIRGTDTCTCLLGIPLHRAVL